MGLGIRHSEATLPKSYFIYIVAAEGLAVGCLKCLLYQKTNITNIRQNVMYSIFRSVTF
jgi:hypothetical protein